MSEENTPKEEEKEEQLINFKDGISIDEAKVSVLVILTIVVVPFCLAMYYFRGDFTENLKDLAQCLIFCIAGVNGVNTIADMLNKVEKPRGERK